MFVRDFPNLNHEDAVLFHSCSVHSAYLSQPNKALVLVDLRYQGQLLELFAAVDQIDPLRYNYCTYYVVEFAPEDVEVTRRDFPLTAQSVISLASPNPSWAILSHTFPNTAYTQHTAVGLEIAPAANAVTIHKPDMVTFSSAVQIVDMPSARSVHGVLSSTQFNLDQIVETQNFDALRTFVKFSVVPSDRQGDNLALSATSVNAEVTGESVRFYRSSAIPRDVTVYYSIVELPGNSRVFRGTCSFGASLPYVAVAEFGGVSVDPDRTVVTSVRSTHSYANLAVGEGTIYSSTQYPVRFEIENYTPLKVRCETTQQVQERIDAFFSVIEFDGDEDWATTSAPLAPTTTAAAATFGAGSTTAGTTAPAVVPATTVSSDRKTTSSSTTHADRDYGNDDTDDSLTNPTVIIGAASAVGVICILLFVILALYCRLRSSEERPNKRASRSMSSNFGTMLVGPAGPRARRGRMNSSHSRHQSRSSGSFGRRNASLGGSRERRFSSQLSVSHVTPPQYAQPPPQQYGKLRLAAPDPTPEHLYAKAPSVEAQSTYAPSPALNGVKSMYGPSPSLNTYDSLTSAGTYDSVPAMQPNPVSSYARTGDFGF